ncbi:MAG: hypothetical protein EU539_12485, partial [Promethearchaeota archaeon]
MVIRKFENILFYNEHDKKWLQNIIFMILILYCITTLLLFISGIFEASLQSVLAGVILIFWMALTSLIFKFFHDSEFLRENFKWIYIPSIFILAIVEETIIYFNGGGLGGKAESLEQDLMLAVPVFVGIAIGIFLMNLKNKLNPGEFFILGAIQGFIVEFLFLGDITTIIILFGG